MSSWGVAVVGGSRRATWSPWVVMGYHRRGHCPWWCHTCAASWADVEGVVIASVTGGIKNQKTKNKKQQTNNNKQKTTNKKQKKIKNQKTKHTHGPGEQVGGGRLSAYGRKHTHTETKRLSGGWAFADGKCMHREDGSKHQYQITFSCKLVLPVRDPAARRNNTSNNRNPHKTNSQRPQINTKGENDKEECAPSSSHSNLPHTARTHARTHVHSTHTMHAAARVVTRLSVGAPAVPAAADDAITCPTKPAPSR